MEFRIAFCWRIFMYIAAPSLGALGIWPFFLVNNSLDTNGFWVTTLILILSTGFIAGCIYSFLRIHREKIVSKNDKFFLQLAFTRRELNYHQVKGFRTDGNYIHIIPKDDSLKTIRVSSYVEDKYTFLNYLYEHFENLDSNDAVDELKEILSNERFGSNKNEREKRLRLAKKTVHGFNTLTVILVVWLMAYPHPYDLSVLLNVMLPILGLFLFYSFTGLIKLDKPQKSIYPNIAIPLIFPGMILALRCIFDFSILSFDNFWLPAILSSSIFFGLFFIRSEELKKNDNVSLIGTIGLFFFLSIHVSSSLLLLNMLFDFKEPSVYQALVIEKDKPSDGNDYKLVLKEGWEPRITSEESPIVSEDFFYRTKIGDSVYVNVYDGAFNIPWYEIDEYRLTRSSIGNMHFNYDVDTTIFKIDQIP